MLRVSLVVAVVAWCSATPSRHHRSHSHQDDNFRSHQPYQSQPQAYHQHQHQSQSHHQPYHQPHHQSQAFNQPDLLDPAMRAKRQAYLPYFPYYSFVPPIYQVHNIYLSPPGYHCTPMEEGRPSRPERPERPERPDRPPTRPPTRPPMRPPPPTPGPGDGLETRFGETNTTQAKQEPSKCVWSIVACCSPGSKDIRYACFELLGCPGAFWDVNPCDERVVAAAANSALSYYMSNQTPTTEPTFQHL